MAPGMKMADIIRSGERLAPNHHDLDENQWRALRDATPLWFIAHWCDDTRAYALFLEHERPLLASTRLQQRRYFALSPTIPAASWAERMAQDLWGSQPLEAIDTAPAIDHESWNRTWPLSSRPGPAGMTSVLHPGDEPLCDRTAPFALENPGIRLGYAHTGLLHAIRGKRPEEALRFIGRSAAGGGIAHTMAYSRAIEQAVGVQPAPAARDGRTILSELERISVHLRDIANTARLANIGLLATHAELAEDLLAELCHRHGASRRLTDAITPQGIAADIEAPLLAIAAHEALIPRMPDFEALHLQFGDRLRGIGTVSTSQVERFSIGGLTGRASGRAFDIRQQEDDMRHVPGRAGSLLTGDAWARQSLRLREIRDALHRVERIASHYAADLPSAPLPPTGSGEGTGAAEGARGDVWYWVKLRDGVIENLHVRDPAASLMGILPRLLTRAGENGKLVIASLGFAPGNAEL